MIRKKVWKIVLIGAALALGLCACAIEPSSGTDTNNAVQITPEQAPPSGAEDVNLNSGEDIPKPDAGEDFDWISEPVTEPDHQDAIDALIAWTNEENLHENWFYEEDAYADTYGTILRLGENQVPVLILYNPSISHAYSYSVTLMYSYVTNSVEVVSFSDWVDLIYPDTSVIKFARQGGGYGEVNAWYMQINPYMPNGGEFAGSDILYPEQFEDDMEFYETLREMFPEDLYRFGEDSITKDEFEARMKDYVYGSVLTWDDIYAQMEPVANWQ